VDFTVQGILLSIILNQLINDFLNVLTLSLIRN